MLLLAVLLFVLAIGLVLVIVAVVLRALHAVVARPARRPGPGAEVIELRPAGRRVSASRSGT